MAVAFDGTTKQITVSGLADFATVDVKVDIYGGWKLWVQTADNAKFLQAMRPVGGDPIGGTQTVPPYFFLMNDWKVLVDGIQNLKFNANLYCEEASNINTNPYLITNNGSIISQTSDAPVNTIEVSTIAYSLELNGKIHLDVDTGSDTGTHLGTIAQPVKTLTKALAIATTENISSILLGGTLVLDQDVSGKEFISHRNGKVDLNNQPTMATRFRELKLYGTQNVASVALVFDCRVENLTNMQGIFEECDFINTLPITCVNDAILRRCTNQNSSTPRVFDITGHADVHLTDWIGDATFINGGASSEVEAHRVSGDIILDASITDGNYTIQGHGTLVDNSIGGVVNANMMNSGQSGGGGATAQQVADAVWASVSRTLTDAAGVTPQDIIDIVEGVWTRSTREITNTAVSSLTPLQEQQLQELWQVEGLDSNNPMTATKTTRIVGAIVQIYTGDRRTTTTATRQ